MNFKIDNLQYCNWSRKIFEINRSAGLDAVHVTIVYHEDYDELDGYDEKGVSKFLNESLETLNFAFELLSLHQCAFQLHKSKIQFLLMQSLTILRICAFLYMRFV